MITSDLSALMIRRNWLSGDRDQDEVVSTGWGRLLTLLRKTVASLLPRAVAPAGFALVPDCPPLETPQQRRALVGKMLLHGWDDGVRHGWFVGRVVRSGVTPGDLRQVPTANFVVRYAAKQTGGELNGLVACELSPRTHGVDQWWVLLE